MKKIFLFAIAAVGMTVGCQKFQEIFNPGQDSLDDGSPVPVMLGTNVSATATTKAALADIDDLKEQTINVYGLLADATDLSKKENFLLGYNASTENPAAAENFNGKQIDLSTTRIPDEDINTEVFYGAQNEVYNFYGYYVGAARTDLRWGDNETAPAIAGNTTSQITIPVIIDGQDDILVAKTNKNTDLANATDKSTKLDRIYSAYSGRRGVVPNLLFEHQLAQLSFVLENGTNLPNGTTLNVKSLKVASKAKADLVITNGTGGVLTPAATDNAAVDFSFPIAEGAEVHKFSDQTPKTLEGSIMVMPNETSYALTVELEQYNGETLVPNSNQKVPLTIQLSGSEPFKAGYSYEVTVKVYAAQAVLVNVSIADWKAGESIYVDNDNDGPVVEKDDTELYATPDYNEDDENRLVYKVNVPANMATYKIQAALSTNTTAPAEDSEGWQDLVGEFTRASSIKYAVFTNVLAETQFYCHLRYKETPETENWTPAQAPSEDDYAISPAFDVLNSYLVYDETSYNLLPDFYVTTYPYSSYDAEKTEYDLPWLVVECVPTDNAVISVYERTTVDEKTNDKLLKTFEGEGYIPYNGLICISGFELGYETLPEGTYVVKVNGIAAEAITNPAQQQNN